MTPDELADAAEAEGLDPVAVAEIMALESGGRPDARNPSGATGLIQFMPSTARGLGTTTEALGRMSAAEQLPYVMRYFRNAGLTADSPPGDYAVAVAAPAFVGRSDDTVVYPRGSQAWQQNRPWRSGGDGDVTVGSIKQAYARLQGRH